MNSVEVGKEFEKQAKEIFNKEGYDVIEESSKINPLCHYDFIVDKQDQKYFIEVRGRKKGKYIKYFFMSKRKLVYLRELGGEVLILLINCFGYDFINLKDINKYCKSIKIGNKKLYPITSNRLKKKISKLRKDYKKIILIGNKFKKKTLKIGKSLGIVIDKPIAKKLKLKKGDLVEINIKKI